MEKFNGWTNRETWLVNLHFGETLEDYVTSWLQEDDGIDSYTMGTDLQGWLEEIIEPEIEDVSLFLRDYMDFSLINWTELAENYIKDYIENRDRIDD